MRNILKHRGLRLIFVANMISMFGSGMNSAAVTWFVLQTTHSEAALGTLLMLQTIPPLFMLPFSGVVIDREDRRRMVMLLDALRGCIILLMAFLAYRGLAKVWEIYLMSILVAAGFWMFWPTINALIQELTPESEMVSSNSFLLAGFQGGWLIAGSIVGFAYGSIGLGGVLFIDFATYVLSFTCYLFLRKGRHTVAVATERPAHQGAISQFLHEMKEGINYVRQHPRILLLGSAWALFLGAMQTQGVVTAPLSDRILRSGAIGYGWLNSGWAVGAFSGAFYTPAVIGGGGHRKVVGISMAVLGLALIGLPILGSHVHGSVHLTPSLTISLALILCVLVYALMGTCRALGGVAITSSIMEFVPKHFMGRVQNTFLFAGILLQLMLAFTVGTVSHSRSLALGFAMIGTVYLLACVTGGWPIPQPKNQSEPEPAPAPAD
ncbi:MAG TPA: MFS transporter [Candidatus Angelobacter sp.]|nr:MFS transporter [Candidatus Angelobacter sp.]